MRRGRRGAGRRGATIVEFAFVVVPLFMFLFGIYEYGRYVMTLQVMENAAREGARYAVVNTFNDAVEAGTIEQVRSRMANVDVAAFGEPATVSVYAADTSGNNMGSPLNATFGQYIAVRIQGDYKPILPTFLFMSETLHMDVRAHMLSEAN